MKTDVLLEAAVVGVPRRRRGGDRLWALPIITGFALLAGWMVIVEPFTLIDRALRAGAAATPEMLLLSALSIAGLAATVGFALCTALYIAALHSMGRLR
jgi:hypothetical protein